MRVTPFVTPYLRRWSMLLFGRRWTQKTQKHRENHSKCRFYWTLMDALGSPWILPAEGLLGAARLARSLRSGPPSLCSGVQRRCATLSNPSCFMSGVRIDDVKRSESGELVQIFCGVCRLRDYSALRASPARFARGRRRFARRSTSLRDGVEPDFSSVGGS